MKLPTAIYDLKTLIIFLVANDHSIILVENPSKRIIQLIKKLLDSEKFINKDLNNASERNGLLLNVTFWLIIDVTEYLP